MTKSEPLSGLQGLSPFLPCFRPQAQLCHLPPPPPQAQSGLAPQFLAKGPFFQFSQRSKPQGLCTCCPPPPPRSSILPALQVNPSFFQQQLKCHFHRDRSPVPLAHTWLNNHLQNCMFSVCLPPESRSTGLLRSHGVLKACVWHVVGPRAL